MPQYFQPLTKAGAPTDGVDEVQTLSISGSPEGGTFTLTFGGQTTGDIAFNATASDVQTALEALSSIGAGNVTCAGGPLPGTAVTITFTGALSGKDVNAITSTDALTGGTTPATAIAETTAGVKGTFRGCLKGQILFDTTNNLIYINSGTSRKPVWTEVESLEG